VPRFYKYLIMAELNLKEKKMSTPIFDRELYKDIWYKDNLVKMIEKQLESVKKQLENDCDLIEIHICGITIDLDYLNDELTVIV